MNERITQLAEHVRDQIKKLIEEAGPSIIESIEVARESQEEGKELTLSIPMAVKWHLDSNKIEVKVSIAVKHSFTHEGTLEDPNQLPLVDQDGEPVTQSPGQAMRKLREAVKSGRMSVSVDGKPIAKDGEMIGGAK